MKKTLIRQLEASGYQARIVSTRRLDNLRETIDSFNKLGSFDEEFYQERLAGFDFKVPEEICTARSLIAVAYRDPQVRFFFSHGGERTAFVVPPTYLHWREKDKRVEQLLSRLLEPEGYRVMQAVVPKKLLAVCSGLAVYGKNNITYVEGMGSFHRLAAFFSDLQPTHETWMKPGVMERCGRCVGCERYCPTGAIEQGRFLLRAERCITFRNEKPGNVAFPDWVDTAWHNSLVGCMHCQRICPENRDVLDWFEEGAEFSEEETNFLLKGVPLAELPASLVEKLERWDLLDLLDILPRNLRAIFC